MCCSTCYIAPTRGTQQQFFAACFGVRAVPLHAHACFVCLCARGGVRGVGASPRDFRFAPLPPAPPTFGHPPCNILLVGVRQIYDRHGIGQTLVTHTRQQQRHRMAPHRRYTYQHPTCSVYSAPFVRAEISQNYKILIPAGRLCTMVPDPCVFAVVCVRVCFLVYPPRPATLCKAGLFWPRFDAHECIP